MIGLRKWLAFVVLNKKIRAPRRLRRGPERNPEYRSWIRTFPCAVCGVLYGIEAAHTGRHGLSQKSSDRSCIPLCREHHQTSQNSLHKLGPAAFEAIWSVNINGLVGELNRQWRLR